METITIDQNNVIKCKLGKTNVLYCVGTPCQLHHTTITRVYQQSVPRHCLHFKICSSFC